ncbi:MAG: T9SS type A sorting domain-containing protein [Ginsengibacter sp.]|jgi:hypothetical protein
MKTFLYILLLLLLNTGVYAQITTPVIKANFGLDGDLRSNFFNNTAGNTGGDDWFNYDASKPGIGVIDTTGAAAILARYAVDPAFRYSSFGRSMAVQPGTIVNNKMMIAAIFYRDYHGNDSTMFASGASKNGMSPADWSCPVSQAVPDKNELLDVMAHMRRDGTTVNDSLWLFGGISIDKTGGDRYVDYELYQTDMYYDQKTLKFYNYGPDEGHTSWTFDASGNILKVGDVIFTANFSSATLTLLEARIWVSRTMWSSSNPKDFKWSGSFDGASNGSTYGYAGIVPKVTGNFYTGMVNINNAWAGHFALVTGDNSVVSNYTPSQFMEFSVNLTKLGLDTKTLLATVGCKPLFNRIFVKSRASTSFTAQLKDFVGPLNLFNDLKAKTTSDVTKWCGIMVPTNIIVTNSLPGFEYTWSTTNGHIIGSTTGDSIVVDSAGTYVVATKIGPGCPAIATDTIVIKPLNPDCFVLESAMTEFTGVVRKSEVLLSWSVLNNNQINYFEVEGSTDGINFSPLKKVYSKPSDFPVATYSLSDASMILKSNVMYYRVTMRSRTDKVSYSKAIRFSTDENPAGGIKISPNPVIDHMQISIFSAAEQHIMLSIYNATGKLMYTIKNTLPKGNSILNVSEVKNWPRGVYSVKVISDNNILVSKMVIVK